MQLVTLRPCRALLCATMLTAASVSAASLPTEIKGLIESSCLDCHGSETDTPLNFEHLGWDLNDSKNFDQWVRVFDRVQKGEMPPPPEPRPDQSEVALSKLSEQLRKSSLARQSEQGRVPARRLTRLEYRNTIQDLLAIDSDVSVNLPEESDAGSFDTVGSNQRISAVHMEAYLQAADTALAKAIRMGRRPYRVHDFSFAENPFLKAFHEKPLDQGGSITREIAGGGVALFADVDYLLRSDSGGFQVTTPGIYRIALQVEAYQSEEPITLKVIRKGAGGTATLLGAFDLPPGKIEDVELTAFLEPGDVFYPTFAADASKVYLRLYTAGGAKRYKGPGLALWGQRIEGPLSENWPPPSTRRLLGDAQLVPRANSADGPFQVKLTDNAVTHVRRAVAELAPRVFRRPPREGEVEFFAALAKPAVEEGRGFVAAVQVPMRAMLSSQQFLMFDGEPGPLGDYALANRLSYFLWKSMPDEQLFELAAQGKLSDTDVLSEQVARLLADDKSARFVSDFLGQWLRLNKVNATTPDEKLYPEFDELLSSAIPQEPELFFAELIKENLSLTNLIDSDFTFVNRRLADHYGLPDVTGQHFRKVTLPADSPRGGFLTQAAVLKTTANGTVTSPVTRGNFVLSNFLGTPPSPPPPSVGSIEPDTRGKTTIREILAAHRDNETCNQCHRHIDPPGFALESFDPIGGFRSHYRANARTGLFAFLNTSTYSLGQKVNSSGVSANGEPFANMDEFKQILFEQREQVARNFVSQLVVYSTGGEIQFADRQEVESILDRTRAAEFPVRDIIHEVVQSRLFRNQ